MPSIARAITAFTKEERQKLFHQARNMIYHPGLDVRVAPTKEALSKILIITPKKSGSAPERNTFKRRLKALFYEQQLYTRHFNFLIFCKKKGINLSYNELKTFILSVLEKATHDKTHS